jgi:hypothetical protein
VSKHHIHLAVILGDSNAVVQERVHAAKALATIFKDVAFETLLRMAQDETAPSAVAQASGEGTAKWLLRYGDVNTAPLADFTGDAYVAFDEEVTRHLREKQ